MPGCAYDSQLRCRSHHRGHLFSGFSNSKIDLPLGTEVKQAAEVLIGDIGCAKFKVAEVTVADRRNQADWRGHLPHGLDIVLQISIRYFYNSKLWPKMTAPSSRQNIDSETNPLNSNPKHAKICGLQLFICGHQPVMPTSKIWFWLWSLGIRRSDRLTSIEASKKLDNNLISP